MEYEIGKWYIATDNRECLFYVTKIEYENDEQYNAMYAYGFDWQGKWVTDEIEYTNYISYDPKTERLATQEEVKEALIKEAIKRGFTLGTVVDKFKGSHNGPRVIDKYDESQFSFNWYDFRLCGASSNSALVLFKDGNWAEIIEKEEEVKDESMKYKIGEKVLVDDDIGEINDYDSDNDMYYIYFEQDDTGDWFEKFEISPMNNQNDKGKEKYEVMNEFEEMELAYKNAERLNNLQTPVNANAAKAINPGVNGRHRDGFTVNRPARTMDFASSKYNRRR